MRLDRQNREGERFLKRAGGYAYNKQDGGMETADRVELNPTPGSERRISQKCLSSGLVTGWIRGADYQKVGMDGIDEAKKGY